MRNIILSILAAVVCFSLTACMKDQDTTPLSSDCYINSVTLGNLKRSVHINKWDANLLAYKDSVYTGTYNGSYYRMAIDQLTGKITNRDSLLYETRLGNMLLTISAVGSVVYRPEGQIEEEWTAYSSTDSIDVSKPLILRVYALDGSGTYRDYRMTLNVCQENPNVFHWSKMETWHSPVPDADSVKVLWRASNDELVVMGGYDPYIDGEWVGYWAESLSYRPGHGGAWRGVSGDEFERGRLDVHTATVFSGELWASTGDSALIYTRNDNSGWWEAPRPFPLRVVTADDNYLYAMRLDSLSMYRMDKNRNWTLDENDAPSMLPTAYAVGVGYDMPDGCGRVMMLGRHGDDALATVWGKTVIGTQATQWVHYPWREENDNPLPALSRMSVIRYNGDLVAIGGDLDAAYVSPDNGVTWKRNYHNWSLPEGLDPTKATSFTADNHGRVWLVNGNDVYCGSIPSQE